MKINPFQANFSRVQVEEGGRQVEREVSPPKGTVVEGWPLASSPGFQTNRGCAR